MGAGAVRSRVPAGLPWGDWGGQSLGTRSRQHGAGLTVLTDVLCRASGVGSALSCLSNLQPLFPRAQPRVQLQSGGCR